MAEDKQTPEEEVVEETVETPDVDTDATAVVKQRLQKRKKKSLKQKTSTCVLTQKCKTCKHVMQRNKRRQ